MNQRALVGARNKGLSYLRNQQREDGGFTSHSSRADAPWHAEYRYRTTFVPALILASLSQLNDGAAMVIRDKLASFILAQRSPSGSYNYWARQATERQTLPYPDDLDDTFCALLALQLHDPKLVTPADLAAAVKLLLATETKVGGPYRTWLVQPADNPNWQDIDLAVNTNVAAFINMVSQPLPNLQELFANHIASNQITSPYYPSIYPLLYYLARSAAGNAKKAFKDYLRNLPLQLDSLSALEAALLLTTLIQIDPNDQRITQLAKHLLMKQQPDGSWPADGYCLDPSRNGTAYVHGSPALTTAFALEALTRTKQLEPPAKHRHAPDVSRLEKQIVNSLVQQQKQLGTNVHTPYHQTLAHLLNSDRRNEIILLPHYFARSLRAPMELSKNEQLYVRLGLANANGWVAYTIYDDFLDEEGIPTQLPAGNIAHRQALLGFLQAVPDPEYQQKVIEIFNTMDEANAWEVTHCRFKVSASYITVGALPRLGRRQKLAERSLGHTLSPLAILAQQKLLDHADALRIERAMRHFLIARQLNDDAHDWKQDFRNGHITYVIAQLLHDLGVKPGRHQIAKLLPKMERQFWQFALPQICSTMQQHIQLGKQLISQNSLLQPENIVQQLLANQEISVQHTMQQRADSVSFLQNYRGARANS